MRFCSSLPSLPSIPTRLLTGKSFDLLRHLTCRPAWTPDQTAKSTVFCWTSCNRDWVDVWRWRRLLFHGTLFVGCARQVCLNGRVQHLEHLLFYGADINAQNAAGDTPLHLCARHNQVPQNDYLIIVKSCSTSDLARKHKAHRYRFTRKEGKIIMLILISMLDSHHRVNLSRLRWSPTAHSTAMLFSSWASRADD